MFVTSAMFQDLLTKSRDGSSEADAKLFALLYEDLRHLARQMLRQERAGHSVQATALVHEAYLRLTASGSVGANDRKHFLALAGRVMRRLLIDRIRRKQALKRPAEETLDAEDDFPIATPAAPEVILDVDRALEKLEALSPRAARIVEWHYLIGLSIDEIAGMLGISARTVHRDLDMAKSFLNHSLHAGES